MALPHAPVLMRVFKKVFTASGPTCSEGKKGKIRKAASVRLAVVFTSSAERVDVVALVGN